MREETVTTVRYNPTLGREVVVRLTYNVSAGPRPDILRWFLVREEELKSQESQNLICGDTASQASPDQEPEATSECRSEDPGGLLPQGKVQE